MIIWISLLNKYKISPTWWQIVKKYKNIILLNAIPKTYKNVKMQWVYGWYYIIEIIRADLNDMLVMTGSDLEPTCYEMNIYVSIANTY